MTLKLHTCRHRTLRCLIALVFLLLAIGARDSVAAAASDSAPAYYLVLQRNAAGDVEVVHSEIVQLRAPLVSLSDEQMADRLARTGRTADEVAVTVRDSADAVVYQTIVDIPRWLRGEFETSGGVAAGESNIEGHAMPLDPAVFVLRVPAIPGGVVSLGAGARTKATEIDLDHLKLSAQTALAPLAAAQPLPGWSNGDPGNRVDILILGDGYTSAQQASFQSDALALVNSFFGLSPYQDYRQYVNVTTLFVASAQSGADQPPYSKACAQNTRVQTCCGDPDAKQRAATTVSTAFDATYCSNNQERLLTVDAAKVMTAAAADPDHDEVMVIVNTKRYGGSGGALAVVSLADRSVQIAQHEYGHTFTRLADEYSDPFPGFPACSDLGPVPNCEPNVTDQKVRASIKWLRWIDPATPIPSVNAPLVATDAGLWEGARYLTKGIYRQGYECRMRVLSGPFCDVDSEAYALRLYKGGWGTPAKGIDNIEPGTEVPTPGKVTVPASTSRNFSAKLLGPVPGSDLAVKWILNGSRVASSQAASGATASYTFSRPPGTYKLILKVTDVGPIVHPDSRASITTQRKWKINVPATPSPTPTRTPTPTPTRTPTPKPSPTPTRTPTPTPTPTAKPTPTPTRTPAPTATARGTVSLGGFYSLQSFAGVGFEENVVASLQGTLNGLSDSVPTDYQAQIDWEGTGTFQAADIIKTGSGTLVVKGSHVYTQQKTFNVTVKATGPAGSTDTQNTASVTVSLMPSGIPGTAPTPLSYALQPTDVTVSPGGFYSLKQYAGVGFEKQVVATFTGTLKGQSDVNAAHYKARINWGDSGQWDTAVIARAANSGPFLIKGTHIYADQGTYPVVIYLNGADGTSKASYTASVTVSPMPSGIAGTPPDSVTSPLQPTDVTVSLGGFFSLQAKAGVAIEAKRVAEVQGTLNGLSESNLSHYHAQINWGDSASWDPGQLLSVNGTIGVYGTHTYSTQGTYPIVVYVNGADGTSDSENTASATVSPPD